VKLYQKKGVDETLSSTLEVVLRQLEYQFLRVRFYKGNTERENLPFPSLSGLYVITES